MRLRLLLLGVPLALLAPSALAQAPRATPPPPPIFEVGIEVINLNVSVTDPRNRYVTDLLAKDFAVYEDGVRQELSLYTHENLPISLALLLDVSASMDEKLQAAQDAATRFVKTLRAQDAAQITQFNERTIVLQDYTNDQALLEAAIRRTSASGPTALHNALYVTLRDLEKQKKAGELRRRAVILLSDGEDTASLVNDDRVIELAKKTEIGVYAISLRPNRPGDRDRLEFSQAIHLLTTLSRDTGGQVFFPNSLSELETVYDRIAEELRTQYNLGYVSSNKRKDGKWRRVVVRVPERSDLSVRHKLGYFAAPS